MTDRETAELLKKAVAALEERANAQSCEDCISRQEAISAIQDEYYDNATGIDIVDIIAHLPSVTPADILDKIKAEIDRALSGEILGDNRQQISDVGVGLELALSIINKYKAESEAEA